MITLITGASGFLGKYYKETIKNTDEIVFSTRNTNLLDDRERFVLGELSEVKTLKEIRKYRFDRLIHFAWQGLPDRSIENNIKNFNMTKNLVSNLLESNANCELNIMGSCLETDENLNKFSVQNNNNEDLSFSKIKNDLLNFVDSSTNNYRWFRIYYAFGNGQHHNSLINFIHRNLIKGDIPNLKNLHDSHDYIYAEDATKLIGKFIEYTDCKKIIEIGTGSATTNYQILEAMAKYFNKELEQVQFSNNSTKCADIKLINDLFPSFKFTSIETSIKKIMDKLKS
jgi:nucleoside-diphosphate-sugar epimerase